MSEDTSGRAALREDWPFLAIVSLVLIVGYVSALRADSSLREPFRLLLFTLLIFLTGALYWLGPLFVWGSRRGAPYLVVLGATTFAIGLMTPHHWVVLGLYPALVGLAIGLFWSKVLSTTVAVTFCLGLLAANLALGRGIQGSLAQLPVVALSLVFALVYVVLFIRQVEGRYRAQALLRDLESAHRQLREYANQVEKLTLSRERERMGRELHDTLAQGLAGLIMQLEAIDGHLEGGSTGRAREVLRQAMQRSRATLHEARRAIKALRASALDHEDLVQAMRREAENFEASTGTSCRCEVSVHSLAVPPERAQDILRIVQESLSNAARHARATHVSVRLNESQGEIRIVIADDGVGFDPEQTPRGFGLSGMYERGARLGGRLRVASRIGEGTTVELVIQEPGT
jgi:NarL family two-component system sensor histidine kinase YdfH